MLIKLDMEAKDINFFFFNLQITLIIYKNIGQLSKQKILAVSLQLIKNI